MHAEMFGDRSGLRLKPLAVGAIAHGTTGGATDAGVSVGQPASPPSSAQKANLVAQDRWEKSLP
jgi:hypothetical protein